MWQKSSGGPPDLPWKAGSGRREGESGPLPLPQPFPARGSREVAQGLEGVQQDRAGFESIPAAVPHGPGHHDGNDARRARRRRPRRLVLFPLLPPAGRAEEFEAGGHSDAFAGCPTGFVGAGHPHLSLGARDPQEDPALRRRDPLGHTGGRQGLLHPPPTWARGFWRGIRTCVPSRSCGSGRSAMRQ